MKAHATAFVAYTGVRFGGLEALRVRQLDLDRRRTFITESVTMIQGQGRGYAQDASASRGLGPQILVDLTAHMGDKAPDDLVFTGGSAAGRYA